MGWLGWTESETLDTSMPSIVLALEGKMEMLKMCYGTPDPPEKTQQPDAPEKISAEKAFGIFRAMAK